jgi:hypothetical protein
MPEENYSSGEGFYAGHVKQAQSRTPPFSHTGAFLPAKMAHFFAATDTVSR